MKNIVTMKMISSEEVICEFIREEENFYVVYRPWGIAPDPATGNLAMYPWTISTIRMTDNEYKVNKNCVMMMAEPVEDIKTSYIEKTSGLTIAANPVDKRIICG